jgi:DNA polymerase-3 subunit chi
MTTAPCDVWFYHLERTALDQALPELLDKTLARGWRALVRAREPVRIEHLDGWLWSYRDDSFLPHGLADEPLADHQPILLTLREDNPNQAQALFLIDGAEAGALDGFERCILLFDGRDPEATTLARERWKTFKQAGHPVSYWRQGAERGWEKQA